MILTGSEIENEVRAGRITIDPFLTAQLNPNSYNVRIGPELRQYVHQDALDTRAEPLSERIEFPDDGLVLQPSELYLGHTVERLGSNYFVPFIGGRSSTGRLGLFVHITAPLGDIGYLGEWTLQLRPTVSLRVYPRQEIGQMFFVVPAGPISLYKGKYNAGAGPQVYRPHELHGPGHTLDPYADAPRVFGGLDYDTRRRLDDEAASTLRRLLSHSEAEDGLRLLDIGCGVGIFLSAAERHLRFAKIMGIDSSPSVLAFAAEHLTRSALVREDFLSFEFKAHTFHVVVALAFLHLFPKEMVPAILGRVASLLGSNGIAMFSTSLHESATEGWEEKASLPGSWRYRGRYTKTEWQALFDEKWRLLDAWSTVDLMSADKEWAYVIVAPR